MVPHAFLGYFAAAAAAAGALIGLLFVSLLSFILSVGTYLWQLAAGVLLAARPHDSSFLYTVAYLLIASFGVALVRAWALLQGRHISQGSPG